MNGNVCAECDWLPRLGSHSGSGEAHTGQRRTLDRLHIRLTGGRVHTSFFFFSFLFFFFLSLSPASVREPSGDQLVTRRPWVSTREYGGWARTGERRGDGDMPEMVKKKQRDASSSMKCGDGVSVRCDTEAACCWKNTACSSL